jgi:hypothetical protein
MAQKQKYFGELLSVLAAHFRFNLGMVEYFQKDRYGNPKGIIAIDLRGVQ